MPQRNPEKSEYASIGQNIAAIRKQRGLNVLGLAQLAGLSRSYLTKIEAGHKASTPKVTAACARALNVPATDLTGQPYLNSLKGEGLEELVQPLRHVISNPMLPGEESDLPPRPLSEIERDIKTLDESRLRGEYMLIGAKIPAIIDELLEHVHGASPGGRQQRAYTMLAFAYRLGNNFAHKLGFLDLSLIALDRMETAAARSSDPLLAVVVAHYRSDYFLHHGAYSTGLRGIRAMERMLEEPIRRGDLRAISAMGTMQLKAAVLHSRQRRPAAAQDAFARIAEAKDLAKRAAGPDPFGLIFDRWNVAVHDTSIRIDLCEPGDAIEAGEKVRFPDGWAQNRTAHHHMDMGRAFEKVGQPKKALQSLMTARAQAPDQTRYHPTTRETVLALLRTRGEPEDVLKEYARWIGV